jgi:hypothetical protein
MQTDNNRMTAVARMILANDGSTTVLLEALTGCRLAVDVDTQRVVPAATVPGPAREALELDLSQHVLERRSCLVTPAHDVVSVNLVVYDADAVEKIGQPDEQKPIGHQLRDRRLPHVRDVLECGSTAWVHGSGVTPCAYKAYIIRYPGGGAAYLHERFNPRWVPTTSRLSRLLRARRRRDADLAAMPSGAA